MWWVARGNTSLNTSKLSSDQVRCLGGTRSRYGRLQLNSRSRYFDSVTPVQQQEGSGANYLLRTSSIELLGASFRPSGEVTRPYDCSLTELLLPRATGALCITSCPTVNITSLRGVMIPQLHGTVVDSFRAYGVSLHQSGDRIMSYSMTALDCPPEDITTRALQYAAAFPPRTRAQLTRTKKPDGKAHARSAASPPTPRAARHAHRSPQ